MFQLTDKAINLLKKTPRQKYLSLIEIILSDRVFYHAFERMVQLGDIPPKSEIVSLMTEIKRPMSDNVKNRRAQTVQAWIKWIWDQGD
jgi:hypothetical protein